MIFMSREQIRHYDEVAINDYGIDGIVLMENAGRGASKIILDDYGTKLNKVSIVAGTGNNGGDGFVVARHLSNNEIPVKVFVIGEKEKIKGDAKKNFEIILKMGIPVVEIKSKDDVQILSSSLSQSSLIIDALFGTGLDREISGFFREVIEIMNSAGVDIVSLDMPSGLDANTGLPLGICVKAKKTITFAFLKRGILVYPGAEYCGEVSVVDIGAPLEVVKKTGFDGKTIEGVDLRRWIKPREKNSHKGTYGHVLIIAGSRGKSGAAVLSARGALRCGSGLVTIAVRKEILSEMEVIKPVESMLEPYEPQEPESMLKPIEGKSAIALGPGCGTDENMEKILDAVISKCKVPLIIDADGLTLLSRNPGKIKGVGFPVILTPHPGEMSRITGMTTGEIQKNRIEVARKFASENGVYLVLKGARTVIAVPDGNVFINMTGNPGMASGGMGDVLTGMITSFCGQGFSPLQSACLAVYIHGKAGDFVYEENGQMGILANQIIEKVPEVFNYLKVSV